MAHGEPGAEEHAEEYMVGGERKSMRRAVGTCPKLLATFFSRPLVMPQACACAHS